MTKLKNHEADETAVNGAHLTDEQANHLTDARAILAAAMTILAGNVTGDHRSPADMIASLLSKVAEDLYMVAEPA